jgi:ACS family hexuronate transporter-like MFS transporter
MRPIRHLRWYIVLLFFFATIISYVDRQALSVNAPQVRQELALSATRYSYLVSAFLVAYTIGPTVTGRLVDGLGVRVGMALFIAWWSVAGMLHAAATGFVSLLMFRGLLGLGEAGTLPSTLRAIAEWFPQRERALATSIFTAGTATGAVVAVPIVALVTVAVGWRACFIVTGVFGFVWLAVWLPMYRSPEQHPRLTAEERAMILADRVGARGGEPVPIRAILGRRKPWGIILGRLLVDPVWSFYVYWLPTYLTEERGFSLRAIGLLAWIPFLASDAGSLLGGWLSGRLLRRGVSLTRARRSILLAAALGAMSGVAMPWVAHASVSLALASAVAFSIGLWAPTALTLCADILPRGAVGTMTGLSGTGAGVGSVIFTLLTGWLVDRDSYVPVFLLAGVLPLIGYLVLTTLVGEVRLVDVQARNVPG